LNSYVYLNGCFLPEAEAVVPISDRGFLFGDGLFTTMRVSDGVIECVDEHLSRIRSQCALIKIEEPILCHHHLQELIAINKADHGIWRMKIIITGGKDPSLNLNLRGIGTLLVTINPYDAQIHHSYKLIVYPHPISRPNAKIKSLSYLDRLQVKQHALDDNANDAIVVSHEGYLLETAFSNLFWCMKNTFITPSSELDLYQGTALECFKGAAKELGLVVREEKVKLIPLDAQVYTCNAMTGLLPVDFIGDSHYSRDFQMEEKLSAIYRNRVTPVYTEVNSKF